MKHLMLVLAILSLSTPKADANSTQGFFFFGDSLTDSGYQNNNPKVKNIDKTPIWTSPNGHTWAYYFLQRHAKKTPQMNTTLVPNNTVAKILYYPLPSNIIPNLDGNNFAAGGATTEGPGVLNNKNYKAPSLLDQINYFVTTYAPQHRIAIPKQEYLLWAGNNNLMKKLVIEMAIEHALQKLYLGRPAAAFHLFDFKTLSNRFSKTEAQIADNLFTAVSTLQKAGAKKIVVLLLPNIGATPLIPSFTEDLKKNGSINLTAAEFSVQMSLVTNTTNALIRDKLRFLGVVIINVNDILTPLINMKTPGKFQQTVQQFGRRQNFLIINNKATACFSHEQALTCIPNDKNATHYVFEDLVHPTDKIHQLLADYIYYQSEQAFKLQR